MLTGPFSLEADKNCGLHVYIMRPRADYTREELDALHPDIRADRENRPQLLCRFGHVYLGLTDENGETRFFDFRARALNRLDYFTRLAGGIGLPCIGSIDEIPAGYYTFDDILSYPIAREQHESALSYVTQKKHGMYQLLLNNCADFVDRAARAAGVQLPQHKILTPKRLSTDADLIARYGEEELQPNYPGRLSVEPTPAPHISPFNIGFGYTLKHLWKKDDTGPEPQA
jgi:hypothetical protein